MSPKKLPQKNSLITKFITMDLETITINTKQYPYLLCWYDGFKSHDYFIDKPEDIVNTLTSSPSDNIDNLVLDLIKKAMLDLCRRKYKGYRIYLHNFSKFDGYFLVKRLAEIGHCDPTLNKGKIIRCKFTLFNTKTLIELIFLDSYLMLPNSLQKLCESFNISDDNKKGIFPIKFTDLTYKGNFPAYKYFPSKLDLNIYNKYTKRYQNIIWDFKEEAIKYCNLDCISLYQVLIKFNELIFNKFQLNIRNYPTLPSLAFGIFRTHYLENKISGEGTSKIHMLSGKISKNIRLGYTGGAVDMYIPKSLPRTIIYSYDVNSLYPFVMKSFKYPVGSPTYFERDITKINPNAFGFFYCKIQAPEKLKHPILQTHFKTNFGTRTIAPLGNWEGMYFSEELYNARNYGYKFEVL